MKTEAKHTPGPWKARDYKTDHGDIWIDCDSWTDRRKRGGCRGGTLATVHPSGTGEGSVEANAALIAAAPTMLEALKTTRRNLLTIKNTHPGVTTYDVWLEVVDAAIQEAEVQP